MHTGDEGDEREEVHLVYMCTCVKDGEFGALTRLSSRVQRMVF